MKKLVIVFVMLFTFVSLAQPGFGRGMGRGDRIGKALYQKLDLSKDQISRIEALRTKHAKVMIDMQADLKKLQLEKREITRNNNIDRKAFLDIEERLIKQQGKIRMEAANHRMDVYSLLTDEQKVKFTELKDKFMEKSMRKGMGRGRGLGGLRGNGGFNGRGNPDCPLN